MDKLKAYSVLGLREGATEDDIKRAYRELAQKYNAAMDTSAPADKAAEDNMTQLNEAFDTLMSLMRADGNNAEVYTEGSTAAPTGKYAAIRQLINSGKADEALAELTAVQGGASEAEWNFLMGSAYYYKGWLSQAMQYFQIAVQLDPNNAEYQAALRNLAGSAEGEMPGNPYVNADPNAAAVNCACNTCTLMCCMDACCGMCRGF